jgi:hypothetical protein
MQSSAYDFYKVVLRAVLLGSVCIVLAATVLAQEAVGKAGESQKPSTPGKAEFSPAPA